jgi:hypothetical protein
MAPVGRMLHGRDLVMAGEVSKVIISLMIPGTDVIVYLILTDLIVALLP